MRLFEWIDREDVIVLYNLLYWLVFFVCYKEMWVSTFAFERRAHGEMLSKLP